MVAYQYAQDGYDQIQEMILLKRCNIAEKLFDSQRILSEADESRDLL